MEIKRVNCCSYQKFIGSFFVTSFSFIGIGGGLLNLDEIEISNVRLSTRGKDYPLLPEDISFNFEKQRVVMFCNPFVTGKKPKNLALLFDYKVKGATETKRYCKKYNFLPNSYEDQLARKARKKAKKKGRR